MGVDVNLNAYPGTPDYVMVRGLATDLKVIAATDRVKTSLTSTDAFARLVNTLVPTGDQQITADCNDAGSGEVGYLAARCATGSIDCYLGVLDTSVANEVQIIRVTTDVFTTIASVDRGLSGGQHSVRLKATGTNPVNLELQVDATAMLTFADSAADRKQTGRPGPGGFATTGDAWVDNVSVDDLLVGGIRRRAAFSTLAPRVRLFQPVLQVRRPGVAGSALNTYVLAADAGSYVLSGNSAQLLAARFLNATAGVYTLTGAAAKTLAGRAIQAAPGSYALTGRAAQLLASRVLSANPGSYVLTGVAAKTLAGRLLGAVAGNYTLSGVAARLLAGRLLTGSPGVYVLNGAAAQLIYTPLGPAQYVLNADPGSYALVGKSILATANRLLVAAAGIYALSGAAADLSKATPSVPRVPEIGGGGAAPSRRKRLSVQQQAESERQREQRQWSDTPVVLGSPEQPRALIAPATPAPIPAGISLPPAKYVPFTPPPEWVKRPLVGAPAGDAPAPPSPTPAPDLDAWQELQGRAQLAAHMRQRFREEEAARVWAAQEQEDIEALLTAVAVLDIL